MSKQAISNVSYPVGPGTTALFSIDCQFEFGADRVRALQPAAG